jgi:hypothetical protein
VARYVFGGTSGLLRFVDTLEGVVMPRFGLAAYLRVARNMMVVDARLLLAYLAFVGRLALRDLMLVRSVWEVILTHPPCDLGVFVSWTKGSRRISRPL